MAIKSSLRAPLVAALLATHTSCTEPPTSIAPGTTGGKQAAIVDTGNSPEMAPPLCTPLFGAPTENTGLGNDACSSACQCQGGFTPPTYSESDIAAIRSLEHLNPPAMLDGNPYDDPEFFPSTEGQFCGVIRENPASNQYRLQTYPTLDSLNHAEAKLTHHGACAQCSSLEDLAVYMSRVDLTGPVRRCALRDFLSSEEETIACIADLGFTLPCAQTWYYNTLNTRSECLIPCLSALRKPYHDEDGNPNKCIQCDEDKSGPIFKAIAGRSRRNSGLPSALCRPCESVAHVVHQYD
jgi:hypothetical protein